MNKYKVTFKLSNGKNFSLDPLEAATLVAAHGQVREILKTPEIVVKSESDDYKLNVLLASAVVGYEIIDVQWGKHFVLAEV